MAAYEFASMITPDAWEPSSVLARIGPIHEYLTMAAYDRGLFELRCQVLDQQLLNLGLHPAVRNPGQLKRAPQASREPVPPLPHPAALVKLADRILAFVAKS